MRSSNPVFSRRGFSRDNGYAGFGYGPAPTAGHPYAQGAPQDLTAEELRRMYQAPAASPAQSGRMTIDDVVMRTAMTLGTVFVGALLAWAVLPVSRSGYGIAMVAALVAFVLGMVQTFKAAPKPALILGYAAFEGVFLGVVSKMFNAAWAGAPVQAVLGTMAVAAGMLIAYRTGLVKVTDRYKRVGMAIAIGFVLLTFVNLLFAAFGGGDGLGLRSGGLGVVVGIVGVLLGAFFLSLEFRCVEDGIRHGAPQRESWLAAFGLTVSLVWIYLEMLRLISILRD
jgi:uncharacterized YccA/Bax inhibitor family protein